MTAFVIHIIKWAVTLTLLYSIYALCLRRETFHALNRAVLVGILLVSALLPAVDVSIQPSTAISRRMEQVEAWMAAEESAWYDTTTGMGDMTSPVKRSDATDTEDHPGEAGWKGSMTPKTDDAARPFSWLRLATLLYLAIAAVFWLRYLLDLAALCRIIGRARRLEVESVPKGIVVLQSTEVCNSCSWMRWVVLSPDDVEDGQYTILTHELAHLRRGHSWDKLLCECTCRTLWFLPFAWMLRQDLADVHEFEADQAVVREGIDAREYNELIIRKAVRVGLQPVANAFNESKIKKRMTMMFKKKSTRMAALKVLYLVPLTAFAAAAFAKPQPADEQTLPPVEAISNFVTQREAAEAVAVLDSTMQAVGARKISEGVYIGAFRPNFTGDTIRVQTVYLANEQGQHTAEYTFAESHRQLYIITLQVEDRKEMGRGYHIRWMYPADNAPTQVHVNNAPAHH